MKQFLTALFILSITFAAQPQVKTYIYCGTLIDGVSDKVRKEVTIVIDGDKIKTIWLGPNVTTDLEVDLVFHSGETIEEAAVAIKRLLQDNGFIFKP